MEYEYNCSYFRYNNITPPNVEQQLAGKFKLLSQNIQYYMAIDI